MLTFRALRQVIIVFAYVTTLVVIVIEKYVAKLIDFATALRLYIIEIELLYRITQPVVIEHLLD